MEPKMLPMPTPAPSDPRPMPSARPIAFPALVTSPDVAAMSVFMDLLLVLRLDRRADVDGGQGSEDERLDRDDDDHLEQVERRRSRNRDDGQRDALEHEHQADEGQDQHVAGEHVGEEPDAEGDQPHELPEDLERHDQREQQLRRLRNPALEVANWPVPANPLEV